MPNLLSRIKGESEGIDHILPNHITGDDYDGLNAFRPSTLMNHVTNLLENGGRLSIIPVLISTHSSVLLLVLPMKPSGPIQVHSDEGVTDSGLTRK